VEKSETNHRAEGWRSFHLWLAALAAAAGSSATAAQAAIPEGFTPLFNGRTAAGWHWSRNVHHGNNAEVQVKDGELILKQRPYGQGGLLLTDKKYKNFEFYTELVAPWGSNSGLFFRSTEGGSAYQVEVAQGGGTGGLLGELMTVSTRATPLVDVNTLWKPGEFNSVRLRMDGGDAPHMVLWINDVKVWDVQQQRNDKMAAKGDGKIGLPLHWPAVYDRKTASASGGPSGRPGAVIRCRNIAIRRLP